VFPSLFLGAAAGLLAGKLPGFSIMPAVAVGMGAAVVSVLKLPLSAVVLAALLTANAGAGAGTSHHRRGGGRLSHDPAVVEARILRDRHPTAAGGSRPSMTAITFSAQRRAIASRVAAVADPMWGRRTVLGRSRRPSGTCGSSS
jgi:hypothetical protein